MKAGKDAGQHQVLHYKNKRSGFVILKNIQLFFVLAHPVIN